MPGTRNSKTPRPSKLEVPLALVLLAALGTAAVWFFFRNGQLYWYGDAEAHLNIARRILDSRNPGYEQFGTVWLPLLHALILPFVRYDALWHNGLAGSIPSCAAYVAAGAFLFAAARRALGSTPAWVALAVFALNPNVLYLQSTAMTEPLFFASLMAMLYFGLLFRDTQSWFALVCAGLANTAASLTRYEGWFLIPFATLYFLFAARRSRPAVAAVYGAVASLGALYWFAHNQYFYSDPLYFFNSPYSAKGIQGGSPYPGLHDWPKAWLYFRTAARLCAGTPLFWIGLAGGVAALIRRAFWPVALLALPPMFYVWSIHSSATPIFVPELWPHSYYNTRYGLALLPLLAFGAAALAAWMPQRFRRWAALGIAVAALAPFLLHPGPEAWITWRESRVNSEGRRAWTREAAAFLGPRYRGGQGIYSSFGDLAGIPRAMRLPLAETLTENNELPWFGAFHRPDFWLHEEWAVCMGGDRVQTVLTRARRPYPNYPEYTLVKRIVVKAAPVIEIYRRAGKQEPQ